MCTTVGWCTKTGGCTTVGGSTAAGGRTTMAENLEYWVSSVILSQRSALFLKLNVKIQHVSSEVDVIIRFKLFCG